MYAIFKRVRVVLKCIIWYIINTLDHPLVSHDVCVFNTHCTCTCDNRFLGRTQKPLSRALIHIPLYDLQIVHTSVCILHLVRKRNFCYAVICTKVVHSLPHILFFIETFIFLLT